VLVGKLEGNVLHKFGDFNPMLYANSIDETATAMLARGCTVAEMREAGHSIFDLHKAGTFSIEQLRQAEISVIELKDAGLSVSFVKIALKRSYFFFFYLAVICVL
jgi:NADH:ubiquinone oxidoreductase subunit B-like Fe-S oxidoreductase